MCGIVGYLDSHCRKEGAARTVNRMAVTLGHRGPDDAGVWVDTDAGIALGHRRLAILDLSPAGHQPMVSASGRYVVAFNGEIYNHLELREELSKLGAGGTAPAWHGHSDTETLLAAFEAWGIEMTLTSCVGMFALALFLRHNYVPAPWSIFENIWKLPPGCYVQFAVAALTPGTYPSGRGEVKPYWSLRDVAEAGLRDPFAGSEAEAVAELERLVQQSIAGQRVADVPLGAFLSGGIDSSTVVAVMQAQSCRPVKTFTIGFHEGEYNEAEHAKAVARHLGTDHTELYVTPEEAMAVIPKLPALYDEPFADSSQIPTFLVAQLARRHVTVSLSGDGGDELFGGYNRYFWTRALWKRLGTAPMPMRRALAAVMVAPSPHTWNRVFALLEPVLPRRLRVQLAGDKMHKLAELVALDSPEAVYRYVVSHWKHPAQELVLGATEPSTMLSDRAVWPAALAQGRRPFEAVMMFLDQLTYLPDDILVKVDRAAMGVSLETRVPLLDHRVVEFAWRLPLSMKIRDGQSKWLLRQMLYKYVPRELIERSKMGFGVPLDQWLRGPLREWAEDLLSEERLEREGFLDPAPVRQKWQEHLSGRRNWAYYLWDVLMWEAWWDSVIRGEQ
ncbi:MAG: asparagine synthase-related protein [Pseudomonadota bacterium]